jgi:hypothetical protein
MRKTVLTFGLLSGAVSSVMLVSTVPFMDRIGFDRGAIVGYTAIVISFLFVYFGVRSYRDHVGGGQLTFGQGFTVGLLITLVSSLCYVVTWQIVYYNFIPDFMDRYAAYMVEQLRASGASASVIDEKAREMQAFRAMYDNPLVNAAFTFLEPFPVGLLMTVLSAALLRQRPSASA